MFSKGLKVKGLGHQPMGLLWNTAEVKGLGHPFEGDIGTLVPLSLFDSWLPQDAQPIPVRATICTVLELRTETINPKQPFFRGHLVHFRYFVTARESRLP